MAAEMTVQEVKRHVRVYLMVFGALLVLTLVTVLVSYLDMSLAPALAVALFIAIIKASLVALYFMHLISERQVIYWVLVLAAAFLVGMFALFISSLLDQAEVAVMLMGAGVA